MTEVEWYDLGFNLLEKWQLVNSQTPITENEASAFEYAWELAWENRKALQ